MAQGPSHYSKARNMFSRKRFECSGFISLINFFSVFFHLYYSFLFSFYFILLLEGVGGSFFSFTRGNFLCENYLNLLMSKMPVYNALFSTQGFYQFYKILSKASVQNICIGLVPL